VSLGALLTIAGALVALVWGVWLGLPGRYSQSADEIEKTMASGGGPSRTVRRTFTPLAWLMRNTAVTTPRRNRRFKVEPPTER
jgi:hypothetical protein